MKITVEANLSIPVYMSKINDDTFWTFVANQWCLLYNPYVPFRNGFLSQQVVIKPKEIEHTVPYAVKMYNGVGMNFRKDHHPLASARWDKAAEGTQRDKLIRSMQNYIDSGRLKLGG